MSARKRGGQPGNLNAIKHGFYSRRFSDLERLDLDALLQDGLDSEIAMLRVATRRVFDLSQGVEDLDTASGLLGVLSMASARLASLLRVQALLGDKQSDQTLSAISQALTEVMQEMKLK